MEARVSWIIGCECGGGRPCALPTCPGLRGRIAAALRASEAALAFAREARDSNSDSVDLLISVLKRSAAFNEAALAGMTASRDDWRTVANARTVEIIRLTDLLAERTKERDERGQHRDQLSNEVVRLQGLSLTHLRRAIAAEKALEAARAEATKAIEGLEMMKQRCATQADRDRAKSILAAIRAPRQPEPEKVNGFVDGDPARYGAACPRACEQKGEHVHIPARAKPGMAWDDAHDGGVMQIGAPSSPPRPSEEPKKERWLCGMCGQFFDAVPSPSPAREEPR